MPHLSTIVSNCLKYSTESKDPSNYFQLLKSLFRAIANGKVDSCYKEFVPMLPTLLEQLSKFQKSSHNQFTKDLCTELILTVPVRLIVLLPYMRQIMYSILSALQSTNPELVVCGLKLMEMCIDNFSADYLEPIMLEYKTSIMQAMWKHLKPLTSLQTFGPQVLKLFGKLSGRGREFLSAAPLLQNTKENNFEAGLLVPISLESKSQTQISLNFDKTVEFAKNKLSDPDNQVTSHLSLLKQIISSFLSLQNCRIMRFPQSRICWMEF